jgi:hypothetical protein
MRTVTVDFTSNKPIEPFYSGEQGENNAVELRIIPSDDMTSDSRIVTYYVAFKVDDGLVLSRTFTAGEEIEVPLGVNVTNQRRVCFQLIAISDDGETVVSKSPIVLLYIGTSLEGDVLPDPITGETIYTEIAHLTEIASELKEIAEHIDLTPIYAKLDTIEEGAEVNVQPDWEQADTTADDYIKNKPTPTVEIKASDGETLLYTFAEILEMWDQGKILTYNGFYIINLYMYERRYLRFYYLGENNASNHKSERRHACYIRPNTMEFDVQSGVFSSEDFTTYLKTKLTNIEENAQRNVQSDWEQSDSSADDFIKNKPNLPDKMNEIYDKTVSNIKYSKYTGSELYSSFLAGRLYCYDGHIIVGMSVVDSTSYFVYYFAGGAITIESDYNCSLRRITLDNNKVLSNDAYCGSFSKADFTSTEKNKLAGIAANAQVNTIEKITDSNGTELTITNKTVALPAIPQSGTITSGSTGYATGGDVYSVVGNVESALSAINTALEDLIGGE